MGVYLGQLPPAELARLKAELAETLIANFCYPRFFDYRTSTLRTRPVGRAKRQEVWLYLSSIDFTAWNRVDLMSPEFQHQIERLLIHFVQRNRNFFGEQGRKRMSDIRMLISMSATSVVQGMRGHLTGQRQNNPPFGSPRPVVSWSTTNVTGRIEQSWEQMLPDTMLLQQQLQELRGEMLSIPRGEAQPPVASVVNVASVASVASVAVTPKRNVAPTSSIPSPAPPAPAKGTNGRGKSGNNGAGQAPIPETPAQNARQTMPRSVGNSPLSPVWQSNAASVRDIDSAVTSNETPVVKPQAVLPPASPMVAKVATSQKAQPQVQVPPSVPSSPIPTSTPSVAPVMPSPVPGRIAPSPSATPVQARFMPPPASPPAVTQQREHAPQPVSEEDIAIFEQLRHQLMVWLRVEVVRSGKDIAGQSPLQLLELLRQQEHVDETRLQVVSTLLNLSNQVIKNGQANVLDYKQALMFLLIHTRR